MAVPKTVLRFPPECFRSAVVGLASQVALLAEDSERLAGPLEWWVADIVVNTGTVPRGLGTKEADRVGTTADFLQWLGGADQFVAGVFMAVRPGAGRVAIRATPKSEDDPWVDMANELFDIRAFDTSSIDVAASDLSAATSLAARFGGAAYPRAPTGSAC